MGSIVLVGLLVGLTYYVLTQNPVPQPVGSRHKADNFRTILSRLTTGWPRQAILFIACLVIAWVLVGWGLATWLGFAAWLGSPISASPWLVTLVVLAIGGVAIHKTNSAPKIKEFGKGQWQKIADLPDPAPEPTIAHMEATTETIAVYPADIETAAEPAPGVLTDPKKTTAQTKNSILRTVVLLLSGAVVGWYLISTVLADFLAAPQADMEASAAEPASSGTWWIVAAIVIAGGAFLYWNKNRAPSGETMQSDSIGSPKTVAGEDAATVNDTQVRKPMPLWLIGAGIVGAPIAVLLAAAFYNPDAFATVRAWTSAVLLPSSASDPAASDANAAVSSESVADSAADVALDTVVRSFVDQASIARGARESIANDLSVALANAERNQQTDGINRFRQQIAEREQAIAAARQSARESITLLAQAQEEAPELVAQAIGLVGQHDAVTSDPKGVALVAAMQQIRGASDAFVTSGMSAWEEAAAPTVTVPPQEAAVASPVPMPNAEPVTASPIATGRRPGVPIMTPPERMRRDPFGRAEQGYSRQSGTARDRQRRNNPDAQIPDDEYQQ